MTGQQEMLALGVRGARKHRDLLARRGALKHYEDPSKSRYFSAVVNQDNLVEDHLRQFKKSFNKSK